MSAFWHIADVPLALTNVCFEGKIGHDAEAQQLSGCSEPLAAGPLLRQGASLDLFRGRPWTYKCEKVAVASS
jgi:hypothetical protein